MNQLITATQITMSSREIAELTGKQVHHIHRDFKVMATELGFPSQGILMPNPNMDLGFSYELDSQNRIYLINLNRDLTLTLVSGYSAKLRMAIIKRWQELESMQAPKLPQSFAQALQLAADQAKVIEDQQAAITLAAPKVEFVDRYVESKGNKGFRQVAKLLKAKESEFRAYLSVNKILYRLGGEWAPYQCHIDAGRFEVSTGTANEHAYNAARFTPKGVEWIAGLWAVHQLRKESK